VCVMRAPRLSSCLQAKIYDDQCAGDGERNSFESMKAVTNNLEEDSQEASPSKGKQASGGGSGASGRLKPWPD
jgi:hypothetical protein